jgi:hypothetical protein
MIEPLRKARTPKLDAPGGRLTGISSRRDRTEAAGEENAPRAHSLQITYAAQS